MHYILCFLCLLISSKAFAEIYYVDATGGDNGDNGLTEETAWQTVAYVNSQSFSAGTTVLFKRGETWAEGLVPDSGNASQPVWYSAYGSGDLPVIRNVDCSGKSYVAIDFIHFYNTTSGVYTVLINNGNHIRFDSCTITASGSGWTTVHMYNDAEYNEFLNCMVNNFITGSQIDTFRMKFDSNYNHIRNCTISNGTHYAFVLEGYDDGANAGRTCAYNHISGNTIQQSEGSCVAGIFGVNSNVIENNYITGMYDSAYNADEVSLRLIGAYNIVRNNLITDNTDSGGYGSQLHAWQPSGYAAPDINGNHYYNNTFHEIDNLMTSLSIGSGSGSRYVRNNVFKNNIFFASGVTEWKIALGCAGYGLTNMSNNDFLYNLIYEESTSNTFCYDGSSRTVAYMESNYSSDFADNIVQDPDLLANYRPDEGSVCIDNGTTLTYVSSSDGSGTQFNVDDTRYFTDGDNAGYLYKATGDIILVGSTEATISDVNHSTGVITVTSSISWKQNDPVSLPYNGDAPDIGFYETEEDEGEPPLAAPKALVVISPRMIRGSMRLRDGM